MSSSSSETDPLAAILQLLPISVVTTDGLGTIRSVNAALGALTGYSPEEVLGEPVTLILQESHHTAGSWRGESVCRRKSGDLIPVELSIAAIRSSSGDILQLVITFEDITARKQSERKLQLEHEQLKAVEKAAGAGTWNWDYSTGQVAVSNGWATLHGLRQEQPLSDWDALAAILHPEDRESVLASLGAAFEERAPNYSAEYRIVRTDGEVRWIRVSAESIRNESGEPSHMTGVCLDLTDRKRLDAFAAEVQRDFERFFNLMPDLACVVSTDGYFKKINPAWEETLGYTLEEVLQTPMLDFIHPDDLQRTVGEIGKQGREYRTEHFINRYRCKNGSYRLFDWTTTFNRDESTRFGVARDITEQRLSEESLRESEERFRIMADSCPTLIWVTDAGGRIRLANRMCQEFFGASFDQAEGDWSRSLIHPDDRANYTGTFINCVKERAPFRAEARVKRFDGEWRWIISFAEPRFSAGGEFLGHVGISPDIRHRKLSEEELQKAKETAEGANRSKGEFLANMSHEIRTPMNGIIGLTDLVLDTELDSEQRGYLEIVRSSADSLLRILNDILDFSKIEAGKLEFEIIEFDLRQAVEAMLKILGIRAAAKELELVCYFAPEIPARVLGDPGRLRQILVNLIGNAIKFTGQGEVVIQAEVLAESAGNVDLHFSVRDTGVGIPLSKQQHVFSAFAQADGSSTRTFGGTGLGLTISSQLVEMMGGRIWLESEEGTGSTFHFTVRLGVAPAHPERHSWLDTTSLKGMPVLVVDDNDSNRNTLEKMLSNRGLTTTLAESGLTALEILKRRADSGKPTPLVVLDVHMPGMDGFTLTQRIKADPRLSGARIALLTSGVHRGEADRSRDLGVSAYLAKPVGETELLDALRKMSEPDRTNNDHPNTFPQEPEPDGEPRLRLLVVEDNPVNRLVATRLLEKYNHTVRAAANGREALEMTERESFDCVLMDVQMPILDGFQATEAIRRNERVSGGHVPIIAMTAHAMAGDLERCLASGMDGYITKPIKGQDVMATVKRVIRALNPPSIQ